MSSVHSVLLAAIYISKQSRQDESHLILVLAICQPLPCFHGEQQLQIKLEYSLPPAGQSAVRLERHAFPLEGCYYSSV
jgi:hypothetical protein